MSKNSYRLVVVLCRVMFLAGCGAKQETVQMVSIRSNSNANASHASIHMAKWSDVPFPMDVLAQADKKISAYPLPDRGGCVFEFLNPLMPVIGCKKFYLEELEREGWRQQALFERENDVLMVYEKPSKVIIVHNIPRSVGCAVHVYIKQKKQGQ